MQRHPINSITGTNTVDVPARFLPALIAGLAYQIGLKTPSAAQALPMLFAEADRQFELAADSAREKARFRFVPRIGRI